MLVSKALHRWKVTPKEAIAIQRKLRRMVIQELPRKRLLMIAGLDASVSPDGEQGLACVVLWDMRGSCVVESHCAACIHNFPYIPGLLSFREIPVLLKALKRLKGRPDALLCDGQGLAHPRRFGLACHLGVIMDLPTVGCAKSPLCGTYEKPPVHKGSHSPITENGEQIGMVVRTRDGVKPVFVSVGHRIDLSTAVQVVLDCAMGYRLPEPLRLAHHSVSEYKRQRYGK
jgi:deoxyribonuclease V